MKRYLWIVVFSLSVSPIFCQDPEESALRELGMGALFADGNLALRQLQSLNDPDQQLKRFFAEAKVPLSAAQQRELKTLVDAQVKALQEAARNEDAIRLANQNFTKKSNEIFTQEQRAELRRYRTEQIMMRGGFGALRLTMENAQTPLTADQEKEVQAIYSNFNRQIAQFGRDSNSQPSRAELDKMENEALGKVVRLLTPAQRRALAQSRQGALISKVRP
jgi:hypothetical protein